MKIAIIGAGNVGRALSGAFVRAGHEVTLSSEHADNARAVAQETGAQAAAGNREAVRDADVVVLAVPYGALAGLVDELGEGLAGKIVVDATNPLRPDYQGLAVEGTSAAEQVQARVKGARVVKAFNSVLAARQTEPTVEGTRVDGFVAGDDERAKATVLELVGSIGLNPIDAGPLEVARALEAMALLNIMLQLRTNGSWQTGWKLVGPLSS
jgi:8-hydroxy-5-deazaflavin:NADPH oxidoreductase